MKTNNISFPYPVLGVGDDILPVLPEDCIHVNTSNDTHNYYFDITLKYENKDIRNLVESGYAEYTCEVECIKTLLRKSIPHPTDKFRIQIPRKIVNGRVTFSCFISVILFILLF